MNREDFIAFVNRFGKGIQALPENPFKKEWVKIYEEIAPHYFGYVPPILRKTFPNEDKAIYEYRKETYQAKTEACLTDAVNNLSRHLSMAKHSVKFESDLMKAYIADKRVEGEQFSQWFLSKFVSNRIIDPNGVLVVNVGGTAFEEMRTDIPVEVFFDFIHSTDIVFLDLDLKLLVYKAPAKRWEKNQATEYKIVTDEFYGTAYTATDGTMIVDEFYVHDIGMLPAVILGGRPISRNHEGTAYTYYKSDISSAIPYLNDAATSDNQYKSVVNANAFPVKIVDGVDCVSCNGNGYAVNVDAEHPDGTRSNCNTCKGTGKLHIGPLEGIYFRSSDGLSNEGKPLQPIQFISPSVDVIQHLAEYRKSTLEEAKEVLNVDKAVKFAQSGYAKEIDKESEYINIKKISDEVYSKLQDTMQIVQRLVFGSADMIAVIPPSSFNIKTEAELYDEFKQAITSGAPDFIRKETFIEWLKSRFSTDIVGQQLGEIVVLYAPLTLSTVAERKELFLMQTVEQNDLIKAAFAFNALMKLYNEDRSIVLLPYDEVAARLDAELQPRFDAADAQPENLDLNDPNNQL
jgi:hypothetical protein